MNADNALGEQQNNVPGSRSPQRFHVLDVRSSDPSPDPAGRVPAPQQFLTFINHGSN